MIRGLVSGIFMGVLLLVFGGVMVSALLPILRPLPVPNAVTQAAPEAPDPAGGTGAGVVAPESAASAPDPAAKESAAESANAGQVTGETTGSAADQAATQAGAQPGAAGADRPRQIASLPAVQGAGDPPASPADATSARPDVAGSGLAARPAPDPLTGPSGAGGAAVRGGEAATLPGTREAARPQAPRRDDTPPAPSAAPAAQEGSSAAQSPSASDTAPVTGPGLPIPDRDTAPGAQVSTTPALRPETGAGVALVASPQADAAPAAPVDVASVPASAPPPPAAPRAPASDTALSSPGLPGRTLQSTPIRPGTAPEISDVAPRFGQIDTGPRPGPTVPLPGPGAVAALPDVGAPVTGGASGLPDATQAPATAGAGTGTAPEPATTADDGTAGSAPAESASAAPGTPARAALPRVRRPGVENDPGTDGPGLGRSDGPVFDGPSAPAAPVIEERALPTPGFSGLRSGVRTGRLPQIGDDRAGAADGGAAPQAPAETLPEAGAGPAAEADPDSPLVYNAATFANPDGRPAVAVILFDESGTGPDRLAGLDLPVTVALDPLAPGAGEVAERYRAAGKEVLILASALPPGARAVDVEVSLAGMFAAIPSAVGLIDSAEGGFQNDRITARHVVEVLGAEGYGLLTHDRGLNAAAQLAEQAGVAVGRVFRVLDAEGEDEETIRRYLDRAAFRAGQQGAVIVMGHNRPETVAALIGWAMEGRARNIALAPVTAALVRR